MNLSLAFLVSTILSSISIQASSTGIDRDRLIGRIPGFIGNQRDIPPYGMTHLLIAESLVKIGPPQNIFEACQYIEPMKILIKSGNALLLKNFVDAGYSLPRCAASDFKNNVLETVQLFRARNFTEQEYGEVAKTMRQYRLDEKSFASFIRELIREGVLSGDEFEALLKDGLSLKWVNEKGQNWFDQALIYRQTGVALVAFDHGLRLPKVLQNHIKVRPEYFTMHYKQPLAELAKIIGPRDRIRLIQESSAEEGSAFNLLPKEIRDYIACLVPYLDYSKDSAIDREAF